MLCLGRGFPLITLFISLVLYVVPSNCFEKFHLLHVINRSPCALASTVHAIADTYRKYLESGCPFSTLLHYCVFMSHHVRQINAKRQRLLDGLCLLCALPLQSNPPLLVRLWWQYYSGKMCSCKRKTNPALLFVDGGRGALPPTTRAHDGWRGLDECVHEEQKYIRKINHRVPSVKK